ncbi:MAG: hypothetical protein IJ309_04265 [Clostridia bacterium]|nr:hypothetical protein [Clostridia bacterium]
MMNYLIKTIPKETNVLDYTRRTLERFFSKKKEENLVYALVQANYNEEEGWWSTQLVSDVCFLPVNYAEKHAAPEVYKLLKQDLIDGEDRYLVDTYEHTENSFCFEFYAYNVSYDPDCNFHILLGEIDSLAIALVENNITNPSILTIK